MSTTAEIAGSFKTVEAPISPTITFDGPRRLGPQFETISLPELSRARLLSQIDTSLIAILNLQDSETGLTAAAPEGRRDLGARMDRWWLRDHAIKVLALTNGAYEYFGEDSAQREVTNMFVQRSIDGMFDLFSKDAWQEGFGMEITTDEHKGVRKLVNSKKAPPIHAQTNGELDLENVGEESEGPWGAPHQPDSWGFLFQAVAQSVRVGAVTLNDRQKELLEQAVGYIVRIRPDDNFRQTSMWENGETDLPPLSSVASVGKGLSDIRSLLESSDLVKKVDRRIEGCRRFVMAQYPRDFTDENNHSGPTDLATLVAMGHDALDGTSFARFLINAKGELMGPNMPGMVRHRGDPYHQNKEVEDGEAAWYMGMPYMSTVLFKSAEKALRGGQTVTARKYYDKGAGYLKKAFDISDEHGYPPELFEFHNGEYIVPQDGTSSHIGWNDAVLIMASVRALKLQEQFSLANSFAA